MYNANDIVSMDGKIGRVLYYDALTHDLHVLNRVSENCWREEKWDSMFCRIAYVHLWDTNYAFNVKPTRYMKSPRMVPMDVDDCHVLMIG
jgi:hypothetical protein